MKKHFLVILMFILPLLVSSQEKRLALVIGNNDYKHGGSLYNCVNDAKAIERILSEKYSINHFRTLYDEQASRENILKELEWIMQNSKEEDNVFIYYSDHGEYNEEMQRGY